MNKSQTPVLDILGARENTNHVQSRLVVVGLVLLQPVPPGVLAECSLKIIHLHGLNLLLLQYGLRVLTERV